MGLIIGISVSVCNDSNNFLSNFLLQENNDELLLEDGSKIIL